MNVTKCPACGGKMWTGAETCPHCGYQNDDTINQYQNDATQSNRVGVSPLIIVVIVALSLILGGLIFMIFTHNGDAGNNNAGNNVKAVTETPQIPAVEESAPSISSIGKASVRFQGKLGGDSNAWLQLNGKNGKYHFVNYERNVRLTEFNRSTGTLLLEAYSDKDDYVGVFKGTVSETSTGLVYKGVFTNYKNSSIDFSFTQR